MLRLCLWYGVAFCVATIPAKSAGIVLTPAGEAAFMPSIAFPFVRMFGPNLEGAFELIATLLMNWCKGWFEMFPNPPVALLRKFMVSLQQIEG